MGKHEEQIDVTFGHQIKECAELKEGRKKKRKQTFTRLFLEKEK